jgi:hypothetical protein
MSVREFVRLHRSELDQHISIALKGNLIIKLNDSERELWVRNDETLYNWARREKVRI